MDVARDGDGICFTRDSASKFIPNFNKIANDTFLEGHLEKPAVDLNRLHQDWVRSR